MLPSFRKKSDRQAAEMIYAACVRAARRPVLYRDLRVPDTVAGRFEMIALHLFAVFHRLLHEPGDDPQLARLVSEAFVADMDAALREMGIGDLKVPGRVQAAYGRVAARAAAYERGLREGRAALAAALGRSVFEDPEDGRAEALADHLLAALASARALDLDALRRGEDLFLERPAGLGEELGA
jgi:cytochrome b pre-mRNA-processing protein 3